MKILNTLANLLVYFSYCLTFLNFGFIKLKFSKQTCGGILGLTIFLAICLHVFYGWVQKKKGLFNFTKTNNNQKNNRIKVINFWFWQIMTIFGSVLYFIISVFWFSPGSQQIKICFYILLPLIFILNCFSSVLESIIRIRLDLAKLNSPPPAKVATENK